MNKYHAITLSIALAFGLTACDQGGNGGSDQQQGGQQQNAQQQSQSPSANEPLATVNNRAITEEQFQFHLERRTQGQPQMAGPDDRKALLDELVDLTLLAQEAENQGLADDPTVAGRLENLRNAVLAQALVEQLEQDGISDDELKTEYEQRFAGEGAQEYHARHILVEDEETARNIIAELEQGADFAALAEEHSQDPGSEGGDLGWFRADDMVPPFANAVRALEPGQMTSEPVQSQFGWHVIRLEETRDAEPPAFEDVQQVLRQMLVQERIESRLEELREQAEINLNRQPE